MLAWKSRVAAEAAPAATIIVVVGGDAVVGHALQLLLRGSTSNLWGSGRVDYKKTTFE